MRIAIILVFGLNYATWAHAQLLNTSGDSPITVEVASEVPARLSGETTLAFNDLKIVFDGGSQVAEFRWNDAHPLRLFFAHSGYWTSAAKKTRTQPVAIIVRRDKKQVFVEIQRNSPLQRRIVELLNQEIALDQHPKNKQKTLVRIRDRVHDRKPLREIEERMDKVTGEFKPDPDPFGEGNPFD